MTFRLLSAICISACVTVPVAASATTMYVHDVNGTLATVDTGTGATTIIGDLGRQLTDIAFDPFGNLFGITFTELYSVNLQTAATSLIGSLGIGGATGLVFGTDGTLYTASQSETELYTVDTGTGAASSLGDIGFSSGGDLAFVGSTLYMASTTERLIEIDLDPIGGTDVGPFGVSNVYGIATADDGTLFGTAGRSIFEVDPNTGAASNSVTFSDPHLRAAYGQAFFDEAGAVIPLPAPMALLLSGLFAFGFLRRRPQAS
ncbi:MAG: hypothetical protein AAGG09_13615 [Pseudomonadota bacterium]